MKSITFRFKHFKHLTTEELYDLLRLRSEIFVVEQNCIYNDLDGLDKNAVHLLVLNEDKLIGAARLLLPGTRFADYSIGRVVVKKEWRGNRLGFGMMEKARDYLTEERKAPQIKVSAQKYLQHFYENLGFEVVTKEYLEDGIPHVGMLYKN